MKNKSTNYLEERLDCLCSMKAKMYDYRHVFSLFEDNGKGEKITNLVQQMIDEIVDELERREEINNQ